MKFSVVKLEADFYEKAKEVLTLSTLGIQENVTETLLSDI